MHYGDRCSRFEWAMDMLLRGMRVEDGRFLLDGYPEGATVRGLTSPQTVELCRLMLFRSDLTKVSEWLRLAAGMDTKDPLQEPLRSAALVKFCCCFEGTSGLRTMPLRRKNIFTSEQRKVLERLRQIRHRAVAHNEHFYPGEFPLVVLDGTCTAIEAVVLQMDVPFSLMPEVEDLTRLTVAALEWVVAEFETVAREVVQDINSMPAVARRMLRDLTPEFKIKIGISEDRFVRK